MKTVELIVSHYYNYPNWYFFIPQDVFDLLEDAYLNDKEKVIVLKSDFDYMVNMYFQTLRN